MIDLRHGDCLKILPTLAAGSVDAVVTDPPYGLKFMGKGWDHGVPGVPYWTACLRVLRPGGYLMAFGGTRTYHRLTCSIEDAGFEIRDSILTNTYLPDIDICNCSHTGESQPYNHRRNAGTTVRGFSYGDADGDVCDVRDAVREAG